MDFDVHPVGALQAAKMHLVSVGRLVWPMDEQASTAFAGYWAAVTLSPGPVASSPASIFISIALRHELPWKAKCL